MTEIDKSNYFKELSKLGLELEKKGKLTYASWADVWNEIKKYIPDMQFCKHENQNGTLGFVDEFGGYAKVSIYSDLFNIDHLEYLAIQDGANKPMKRESYKYIVKKYKWVKGQRIDDGTEEKTCQAIDSNAIQKTYQRCLVKAIAEGTGLGLYVYRGEDLPDVDDDKKESTKTKDKGPKELTESIAKNMKSALESKTITVDGLKKSLTKYKVKDMKKLEEFLGVKLN